MQQMCETTGLSVMAVDEDDAGEMLVMALAAGTLLCASAFFFSFCLFFFWGLVLVDGRGLELGL